MHTSLRDKIGYFFLYMRCLVYCVLRFLGINEYFISSGYLSFWFILCFFFIKRKSICVIDNIVFVSNGMVSYLNGWLSCICIKWNGWLLEWLVILYLYQMEWLGVQLTAKCSSQAVK